MYRECLRFQFSNYNQGLAIPCGSYGVVTFGGTVDRPHIHGYRPPTRLGRYRQGKPKVGLRSTGHIPPRYYQASSCGAQVSPPASWPAVVQLRVQSTQNSPVHLVRNERTEYVIASIRGSTYKGAMLLRLGAIRRVSPKHMLVQLGQMPGDLFTLIQTVLARVS